MFDVNAFGREMMRRSVDLKDDALCNDFAKVGDLLTRIGQPGAPKTIYDLKEADWDVIAKAVEIVKLEKVQ